MYYSDYNRSPDDRQPIEAWDFQVHSAEPEPPKKKSHLGLKIAAACLACALIGGLAGAGGAILGGRLTAGRTVLYEGARPLGVTTANVQQNEPLTPEQIYAANVNSAVGITTEVDGGVNFFGQTVMTAASGSGFIVSQDGYIVTNYHVIDGAQAIKVTLYDGTSYPAKYVGGDEENDLAVLKVEATGLTPVVLGSSDELVVGDQVFAIGNPLGELTFSFTGGYVSALDRSVTMSDGRRMNYIQTDTAINSGNSGGPLFNSYGQVVGIVSAKLSGSGSSTTASVEGLGFAIPLDDVKDMIKDIIQHGYITGKPYLGIIHASVSSEAQWYGTPAGSYVLGVVENSCADKAGLQTGDIITAVDDTAVTSQDDLQNAMKDRKAGDTVTLTVYRSGEKTAVTVKLDERTDAWDQASQALQDKINEEQNQRYQQQQQQNSFGYGWPFGW